jgi:tetratricopeptide (TPR) repeat protein
MLAPPDPPRPSLVPPWFAESVDVAGHAIPRWAFALPLAAFLSLFWVGSMLGDDAETLAPPPPASAGTTGGPAASGDAEPKPAIPVPDRLLALQASAEFGDDKAIAELLAIPESQRDDEVWLVVGEGYMRTKRAEQALRIYQKAIAHRPGLAEHEQIASNVRLAARDGATATLAVTVAAESLGGRGGNVLFSIWADTARRTEASALAERYLEQDKILEKASREVRLALDLRKDNDCSATRRLLQSAFDYGDSRGLHPMAKLRASKGCGPHKNDDCYPCLRNNTLLEDAIAAAAKRIAPKH